LPIRDCRLPIGGRGPGPCPQSQIPNRKSSGNAADEFARSGVVRDDRRCARVD